MHLSLYMPAQHMSGDLRHPQQVLKDLGIDYQVATPQSIGDCWWFWNCCIPEGAALPDWITEFKANPMDYIGFGLSQDEAKAIEKLSKELKLGEQVNSQATSTKC